jgi:hypothetical protein
MDDFGDSKVKKKNLKEEQSAFVDHKRKIMMGAANKKHDPSTSQSHNQIVMFNDSTKNKLKNKRKNRMRKMGIDMDMDSQDEEDDEDDVDADEEDDKVNDMI